MNGNYSHLDLLLLHNSLRLIKDCSAKLLSELYEEEKAMSAFFFFCCISAATILVHGQRDFINIDCGIAANFSYINNLTGLEYCSDAKYIDTGENHNISSTYQNSELAVQNFNLRSFPDGTRNCYTLKPIQQGKKYMIRAGFMYGNYDSLNQTSQFDIYLGVNFWDSMNISNASTVYGTEIMTVAAADFISVCLVNTGHGTPFISSLEVRCLENVLYDGLNESNFFVTSRRLDMGSTAEQATRFPDDEYDRMWFPYKSSSLVPLNTSSKVNGSPLDGFQVPSTVMRTAVTPSDGSSIQFFWNMSPETSPVQYHIFLHFAEIQELSESRIFDIFLDGNLRVSNFSPPYLKTDNKAIIAERLNISEYNVIHASIVKATTSTLPPILNAIEVYKVKSLLELSTDNGDVDAIRDVKATYGIKKNWIGDPCAPRNFMWDGLNCSFSSSESPRIIYLNLANSGLSGDIAASLAKLGELRYLDLSGNSLKGQIPNALGELPSLQVLNLSSNKLSGPIPILLHERQANGSLILRIDGNPDLCDGSNLCQKQHNISVAIIIVIVAIAAVFLLTVAAFTWRMKRWKQIGSMRPQKEVSSRGPLKEKNELFQLKNQQFTFEDLVGITKNFEHEIGKGGFGTVYYGELEDGTQVAVKLHSQSSSQGIKEFQAEAELLTRIHHKNLVSSVGYCEDENYLALVYEYMAQGSLEDHLRGKASCTKPLHWIQRLQIAIEAAQGLEYLHSGCKPPIIHRDVKTTNILLSHKGEAKISDFGVSRVFQSDLTHVSTAVVGTAGYLDPEYYLSCKLNEKSDVYSFGVVLLELITGLPPILRNPDRGQIVYWVSPILARGDIGAVIDDRMQGEYDTNSVWKAAEIAIKCTLPSIERPTMSEVVIQLKECLALEFSCGVNQMPSTGVDISYSGSVELMSAGTTANHQQDESDVSQSSDWLLCNDGI